VMFQLVCLGWVFFRSPTPGDAWAVLGSIFAPLGEPLLANGVFLVLAIAVATHVLSPELKDRARRGFTAMPAFAQGVAYALLLGLLLNAQTGEAPFIYFQF
jgi:alginate O-acetyltransferase complex protein AlgI